MTKTCSEKDSNSISNDTDDNGAEQSKRRYKMSKRAETSAQTAIDIYQVTVALWHERPLSDITLETIAERANVSVRTIIRRFGSKEGLFEDCIKNNVDDMESNRHKAKVGDIEGALNCLLDDYEAHGDAMIRTLAVEEQLAIARRVLQAGRIYHREWCARIFAPYLPASGENHYDEVLLAFVAATEIYLWKLLRRDLNYDLPTTRKAFLRLVQGLVNNRV
jgi:AcrR family transcriptional regulator